METILGGFAANWSRLPRFKRQSPGRKHPGGQGAAAAGRGAALALLLADLFFLCACGCLNLKGGGGNHDDLGEIQEGKEAKILRKNFS